MGKRNLSLTPRIEGKRDKKIVSMPVHFSLSEIKQHFDESMQSVKNQLTVADNLLSDGNIEGCHIIWRSQIVFAEGLLDFYIHEMSKYCLFRMFNGEWKKSEKYKNLQVKMSKVEEGLAAKESNEWFFEFLNERFSKDVFLSGDSMRDQLNLLGIKFGEAMHRAFQKETTNASEKYGYNLVKEHFERRNKIAHQNDREHSSAIQITITKEYVEQYISETEAIVTAIHNIAKDNDSDLDTS